MGNLQESKEIFRYYFKLIAERAGVRWDLDNDIEIGEAIGKLYEAAVEDAVRKIKESNNEPGL